MTKLSIRRLHSRVRKSLEQSGIGSGKRLVVAVSGGPDSLTLLYALSHLRDDMGFGLHGAHLNHNLRGEASISDARFVSEKFDSLGIPYTLNEADVSSFQKERRLSLEEAARELRYDFLSAVAVEQNADAIVLGHTADDQAETVLMHVIRGSGLTGLRGMESRTRRTFDSRDVTLLRPLLNTSRAEILEYCRAMKLEPRQDESNLSPELARNRVRLELMPMLEQYNPSIRDALVRLSRSAAQDMAFIESHVDTEWNKTAHVEKGVVTLNRSAFSNLSPAIANHLLRQAVLIAKGDLEDVEQNHIEDMARLMTGKVGKSLDIPGGLMFSVGYDTAALAPSGHDFCPFPQLDGEHPLRIPGETLIPGWRITARIVEPRENESKAKASEPADSYRAIFDYDSLGNDLWIRARRPGDRIQPLGMPHTKKIQDVMVDAKIPGSWRGRVPLVVSPKGVAWIAGCRIADWARVKADSLRKLELRFEHTRPGDW